MSHRAAFSATQLPRVSPLAPYASVRPCFHEPAVLAAAHSSRSMGHDVRNLLLHRRQAPTM